MGELRFSFGELLMQAFGGTVTTKVGNASCFLFSTTAQACPLCQAWVPANTRHECEQGGREVTVGRGKTKAAGTRARRRP